MMELLIGSIASGKSSYTNLRVSNGAIVVNDDAIVMAIHSGQYDKYDEQLKPLYKQIELTIIHFAATINKDVIIDRPNSKKDTRQRYIQIAKSLNMNVVGVFFPILDADIHLERRMKDPRGLPREHWEKAIKENIKYFEPPEMSEGFLDIVKIGF